MSVRLGQEVQALPRAARLTAKTAPATVDRTELRRAYRPDEELVSRERIEQARLEPAAQAEALAIGRALAKGVRAHKPSGLDAFLHAYDLGSDEGIAMMCLAEALLRIPDAHTADELIADKLSGPDWADKLGETDSAFVNAATFSLLLTGKVLEGANAPSVASASRWSAPPSARRCAYSAATSSSAAPSTRRCAGRRRSERRA
jgi:RHH-type proline utilization regulon transcriptional repressor/proline dehydrogenase/delta 1-pyrroline-5-carboxylate dehydrogenase